jgi:RNA-binding protein Musashi
MPMGRPLVIATSLHSLSDLHRSIMSDLDADLYGDLYGNDETDFAGGEVGNEEKDNDSKPNATVTATPSSSIAPVSAAQAAKPASGLPQTTSESAVLTTSPIPSFTSSMPTTNQPLSTAGSSVAPQKIPTYEQSSDYASPLEQSQANFQAAQNPERSVRPSEMKDEGKMFIGGLNWDTTDESLRNYFSQFGKVDACTIMRDAAGRSRCFAFLTFEEPASVNAVMVREHFLDGKIIDPKRAIPRQEHQRATKLFIGGLAGSVTSESMREFFSQYGKVIDSTVMLDRETGRSKGFGFVSLEDTDVQPILGFGNLEIDGKLIDVKLAQPRYQRDTFAEDGDQSSGGNAGPAGGVGRGAGNNFGGQQQGNFNAAGNAVAGAAATPGQGNTPFDPQALATLYTRARRAAPASPIPPISPIRPMPRPRSAAATIFVSPPTT